MSWSIIEYLKPGSSKKVKRLQEEKIHNQKFNSKKQRKRWWHKWQPDYEGTDYDPIENKPEPEEDVD